MPRHADPHAREALLARGRAEFARKGLRGARIEDITAACGLSKGAFYLHFPSKESMFEELVETFRRELGQLTEDRHALVGRMQAQHGALEARDVEERTARYCAVLDAEVEHDLQTLEAMWRNRDILQVLISGCQGTPFEGAIWELIEAEVARVATMFEHYQRLGTCRSDVPPELFGSMIVGTYFLLAQRMSRAQEKPDLRAWADSLHRLVTDGSLPRTPPPRPARGVQKASARAQSGRRSPSAHRRANPRSTP